MLESTLLKRNRGLKIIVLLFFSISILLLLSILFLTAVVFFLQYKSDDLLSNISVEKSERYQYYRTNFETKETSVGFSSIYPSQLEDRNFITYKDEYGNTILISDFETSRYQCFGTCYCRTNEKRRSTTTSILRNLIYLVAASSSMFAMKIAKNHFDEECKSLLSSSHVNDNICPSNIIRSEIEMCNILETTHSSALKNIKDDDEDEYEDDEDYYENSEYFKNLREFQCSGHCLPRTWINDDSGYEGTREELEDSYWRHNPSNGYETEKSLQILQKESDHYGCGEIMATLLFNKDTLDEAIGEFKAELENICIAESQVGFRVSEVFDVVNSCKIHHYGFSYVDEHGVERDNEFLKMNVCTATINGGFNPSISCIQSPN